MRPGAGAIRAGVETGTSSETGQPWSECTSLPAGSMPPGLDGLKRVEVQWGFQDDAMLAVAKLVAPQPRRGLLAMLDQPNFTPRTAELKAIPARKLRPSSWHDSDEPLF